MGFEPVHGRVNAGADFVPLWAAPEPRPPVAAAVAKRDPDSIVPGPFGVAKVDGVSDPDGGRTAYDRGVLDGQRAALEKMNANVREQMSLWAEAIEGLSGRFDDALGRFTGELEERMVVLSTVIAKEIVHGELSIDRQRLLHIVGAALERVREESRVTLRVAPDDKEQVEQWLHDRAGSATIFVSADSRLHTGDLHVDIGSCSLDFSIESQIERIRTELSALYEKDDA